MTIDNWLPIGYQLPTNSVFKSTILTGNDWQIYESKNGELFLIVKIPLATKWINRGLLTYTLFKEIHFGKDSYLVLSSSQNWILSPIMKCDIPKSKSEAYSFALALRETRKIDEISPLHDALYIEKYSRLLPTFTLSDIVTDDFVLGAYLTGGVHISINSIRRLSSLNMRFDKKDIFTIAEKAGLTIIISDKDDENTLKNGKIKKSFELPGRKYLQKFFREHIIDIVENPDSYAKLGIDFPSAVALHGPPGGGKTFAVELLAEYLDWPVYRIDSSSIGSPYIHETSKKIGEVFNLAENNAPSIIIIDEMEAFLSDRSDSVGSGHHRIEEVGEFLRRIPNATKNQVLIIAMTNKIDLIDNAILRRGRFDHIVEVGMPTLDEIIAALKHMLKNIPFENNISIKQSAKKLVGHPLSDAAFIIKEAARVAAKSGKTKIDAISLDYALEQLATKKTSYSDSAKIGFT